MWHHAAPHPAFADTSILHVRPNTVLWICCLSQTLCYIVGMQWCFIVLKSSRFVVHVQYQLACCLAWPIAPGFVLMVSKLRQVVNDRSRHMS